MGPLLLKNNAIGRIYSRMTHHIKILTAAVCFSLFASASFADCTAVYKAKQDNPLRLDHGSMSISGPCTVKAAKAKVEAELASKGWTLLKVLSVSKN